MRAWIPTAVLLLLPGTGVLQDPEAPSEDLRQRRATVTPGKPVDTGADLKIQTDTVDGLALSRIGIAGTSIDGIPVWSSDGKTLFVLESRGTLRRISVPSFREERKVELGIPATRLNRSREGLIVHVKDLEEVWVIDESRLTVKSRLHAPRLTWLSSAPSLSLAFGSAPRELRLLDLRKGGWAARLEADRQWHAWKDRVRKPIVIDRMDDFSRPTPSPDGKYLYWISSRSHWRGSIRGATIEAEEAGYRFGGDEISFRAVFSADSQLVTFTYATGNGDVERWPKKGVQGHYIFKADNLQQPTAVLNTDAQSASPSIDKAAGAIYCRGQRHRLEIWTMAGVKTHELLESVRGNGFTMAHPDGRRVLLQSGPDVHWVQIPEGLPTSVSKGDPAGPSTGKPEASSRGAAGPRLDVDGLALTEIRLQPANPQQSLRITASQWSPDGRALYLADSTGSVAKLSVPDLREERRVMIGGLVEHLSYCREGLVTFARAGELVWLLNPQTLEVKSKIPVKRLTGLTTSPASALVFCNDDNEFPVLDMKSGSVVRKLGGTPFWKDQEGSIHRHPDSLPLRFMGSSQVTPDGRHLFVQSSHRFGVKNLDLLYEEAGPPLSSTWMEFSPDSRYVAKGVRAGAPILYHPTVRESAVFIYKVKDLTEPIMILDLKDEPCGFGFDLGRKKLILHQRDASISVYGSSGERERVYVPWKPGHATGNSLRMSPVGGMALVVNSRGLFLAQFPN